MQNRLNSIGNPLSGPVSLTDKERDEFDYETRLVIQRTMTHIRHLEDLEAQRLAREKESQTSGFSSFFGGLGDDTKAEAQTSKTLALHRAGMLWFLNEGLKTVSQKHSQQQEIRLNRQLERTKNTLHNVSEGHINLAKMPLSTSTFTNTSFGLQGNDSSSNPGAEISGSLLSSGLSNFDMSGGSSYDDMPTELRDLTPQQVQELETENTALLDELELSLNKAKAAEKSLMEISSLQSSLSAHLSTQNDHIQSLLNDSEQVHDDILKANKQLDSAKERNRKASKLIVMISLILAFVLLFYDALIS